MGAINAQHWAHSRNRPTATDEKKKSLLCFGCDFSAWYNLEKIIKSVATRCHISKLLYTKFDFGWGYAPELAGRASLQRSPSRLAGFKGPTSAGNGGMGRVKGRGS